MNYRVWLSDESRRKEVLEITRGLRFRPGYCYDNAHQCVMADRIHSTEYVEGYVAHPVFGKMIHAWCRFKGAEIYFDPTPNYVEHHQYPGCRFVVVRVYDFSEYSSMTIEKIKSGYEWPHPYSYPYTTGLDLYCRLTGQEDIPFNAADYTHEAIDKMVGRAG